MAGFQVGCDVCQVASMEQILQEGPDALERLFNPEERQYALAQKRPAQHLAGVFAAKEALAKAIREPALLGKYYRGVTVRHRENGMPTLELSEELAESLSRGGLRVADLSISHDGDYAVAAVLVEKGKLECDRCSRTLSALAEQGIADALIPVVTPDGQMRYRCPVCMRGW